MVSLDQAHSLGDVLGCAVGHGPENAVVSVAPGLDVLELDTLGLVEARYRSLSAVLAVAGSGHEHGVVLGAIDPEEIVGAPGVQDLLGLHHVVELVDENTWDAVFVDFPATADALRSVQLPELLSGYLERLWPQHDRIVAGTGTDPRLTILVALLERVVADADSVRALLFDDRRTTATLVTTADSASVAETRRTLSAAALTGLPVDTIVVNMLLPQLNSSSIGVVGTHPAVYWFEAWRSAQQLALREIVTMATGYTLTTVERAAAEPVGLVSLGALDVHVGAGVIGASAGRGTGDVGGPGEVRNSGAGGKTEAGGKSEAGGKAVLEHGAHGPVVAHESGSGLESIYTMTMMLPVVDPATLELGRVGDDLIVGADGVRRRVRLESVLRRCDAVAAEFSGGALVVRFSPDPTVWPT